jgi:hypothetical protein
MRNSKRCELREAIRKMVRKFRSAGKRFFNENVVDAVITANDRLFAELGRQLARERLFDLTRQEMKSVTEMTETEAQLDLGLDMADFRMPQIIAVPVDPANPLNGEYEWVPVMQATVADLDANLRMLDLQIEADRQKRRHISILRQRVVAVIGENSSVNVAEAAAMARKLQIDQKERSPMAGSTQSY